MFPERNSSLVRNPLLFDIFGPSGSIDGAYEPNTHISMKELPHIYGTMLHKCAKFHLVDCLHT